jgi:hypothetical protein
VLLENLLMADCGADCPHKADAEKAFQQNYEGHARQHSCWHEAVIDLVRVLDKVVRMRKLAYQHLGEERLATLEALKEKEKVTKEKEEWATKYNELYYGSYSELSTEAFSLKCKLAEKIKTFEKERETFEKRLMDLVEALEELKRENSELKAKIVLDHLENEEDGVKGK